MSRSLWHLGCGLLLMALSLSPAAAQARHFPADEDLEATLRYLVEDTPVPGMVLGVLEADGSTRIVTYGTAGSDARPLGPGSVFEIGSITKTFTGTLLADMVARGDVSLDDPAAMYLPATVDMPSRGGREVTLLDLATHRSGLPRLASNHFPADPENPYADYTIDTMYAFLSSHELRRDPGAEYEYSNLGFQLLGHVLSRASGETLTDLVRSRMLDPLEMDRTDYELRGEVAEWMARGHRGLVVTPYHTGTEARRGAGGLRSSAIDMLKYLKANVGPAETPLERAMRSAHRPRVAIGDRGSMIGLAWVTTTAGGRRIVEHGGGTGGFTTRIAFDAERRVGFVLLTNSRLGLDVTATELLAFGPPLDIAETEVASELLAEYAGAYSLGPDRPVYVRLEREGHLTVQYAGRARAPLYAASESSFFMKQAPLRMTFQRSGTGEVDGLVIERRDSEPRTATRTGDSVPEPQAVRGGAVWSSVSLELEAARSLLLGAAAGAVVFAILLVGLEIRRRKA